MDTLSRYIPRTGKLNHKGETKVKRNLHYILCTLSNGVKKMRRDKMIKIFIFHIEFQQFLSYGKIHHTDCTLCLVIVSLPLFQHHSLWFHRLLLFNVTRGHEKLMVKRTSFISLLTFHVIIVERILIFS